MKDAFIFYHCFAELWVCFQEVLKLKLKPKSCDVNAPSSAEPRALIGLLPFLSCFAFFETEYLCSSGCPRIHCVDQDDLRTERDPQVSASQALGVKARATKLGLTLF